MCGCRNFNLEGDRHESRATQQVNERAEIRITCVLGFSPDQGEPRDVVLLRAALSGSPASQCGEGLDAVPGLLKLAGGRSLDKNGNGRVKHYDLIRYPWGTTSCYFRLNWAFCF